MLTPERREEVHQRFMLVVARAIKAAAERKAMKPTRKRTKREASARLFYVPPGSKIR